MNFEFHPEAERELFEATFRYELDVPGLGRRFADEVGLPITDATIEEQEKPA